MKSASASEAYCTSAGEELILFMLHLPHSAVSCCLVMRCGLTRRLWKTVVQLTTQKPFGEISWAHKKVTPTLIITFVHYISSVWGSHSHAHVQAHTPSSHKTNKSLWQMLAIRSDHNTRYLTIQITFPWQVCRQHIWRGRVNDRARENDSVHAPRNSLCREYSLKTPVCP